MSEQDNIRLAEEYVEAVNAHDYARMSTYHSEGVQVEMPGMPEPLDSAAYQDWNEGSWAAFPDQTLEIQQIVTQGDHLVVNYLSTGTHQGPLPLPSGETVPATGRKMTLPCSTTVEVKDGKFVRSCHYWDNMTLLAQLGITPGA